MSELEELEERVRHLSGDMFARFLEGFPTVSREQVIAFLEEAKARVESAGE